jgi:hypothetical protein
MKSLFVTCALLAGAAAATSAQAACTQAQLAGTWRLYFQGHYGQKDFGYACTLVIEKTGSLAKGSGCADTLGRTTPMTGSLKLTNPSYCDYDGKITLTVDNDVNDFERTTLSPDHNVMSGVAYDEPSGIGYAFTMVRV